MHLIVFSLNVELKKRKLSIKDLKLSKLRKFSSHIIIALSTLISLPGHKNTNNDGMWANNKIHSLCSSTDCSVLGCECWILESNSFHCDQVLCASSDRRLTVSLSTTTI